MTNRIEIVGTYPTMMEADFARAVLAANGIEAAILTDDAGGMIPSLTLLKQVRLAVPFEDADIARELLGDPPSSRPPPETE